MPINRTYVLRSALVVTRLVHCLHRRGARRGPAHGLRLRCRKALA